MHIGNIIYYQIRTLKRKDEVLSEEEIKAKELKAAKVLEMSEYFFKVRSGETAVEDPLAFTELVAQLCTELGTIYNFRREVLIQKFEQLQNQEGVDQLKKLIQNEIVLITVLLKKHPKSYTLWTHRQWVILRSMDIDIWLKENNFDQMKCIENEYLLCAKMLKIDERNFHVWNYRNWLNSISNHSREDQFTKEKIEQNFSNFSAYHFRAKYFMRTYNQQPIIEQRINTEGYLSLIPLPLNRHKEEIELIQQAIYIQPKENGVYLYHQWLMRVIQPFGLVTFTGTSKAVDLVFNKKIKAQTVFVNGQQVQIPFEVTENKFTIRLGDDVIDEEIQSRFILNTEVECELIDDQFKVIKIKQDHEEEYQQIQKINTENIEFIESILQEEPNNRFAHIQYIQLLKIKLQMALLRQEEYKELTTILKKAVSITNKLISIQDDHQAQYLNRQWTQALNSYNPDDSNSIISLIF